MKCVNCGYEIVKPNLKTCPLCGKKVTVEDALSVEGNVSSEQTSVETESSTDVETENPAPRNVESQHYADMESDETSFEPSNDTYQQGNVGSYNIPPIPDNNTCRVNPRSMNHGVEPLGVQPLGNYPQADVTPENPDQYIENGVYQPYPDEVEEGGYDDSPVKQSEIQSSAWLITTVAAIAGLLIGSFLYFVIG